MPSEDARTNRLETLLSRYERALRRFLGRHLHNKNDIDDCVQESFLNVWRQEKRGTLWDDPSGYLFITARNVARDFNRKARSRRMDRHVPLSEDIDLVRSLENETTLMHREGLRLIEEQLETLKPSTRLVFLLHYVELMPFDKIASRLGISTRTVEREIARALDHCRSSLAATYKDILNE